jgi:hypothetical protein
MMTQEDIKRINDAYINGYNDARLDDPLEDICLSIKALIVLLAVVAVLAIVAIAIWGK